VREQLAQRDPVLGATREFREKAAHLRLEVELALVHEHHRERRGHHDLGQAGEVVDRVGDDGRGGRVVREPAESAQVNERALPTDRQHGPGERPRGDPVAHDRVHRVEATGPEARGRLRAFGSAG
jgi:hypothetical protein